MQQHNIDTIPRVEKKERAQTKPNQIKLKSKQNPSINNSTNWEGKINEISPEKEVKQKCEKCKQNSKRKRKIEETREKWRKATEKKIIKLTFTV